MSTVALKAIQQAVRGLLYPSEADSLFEVFQWEWSEPVLGTDDLRSILEVELDVLIEKQSLDEFFRDLIEEQDWHDDEDKKVVQRYRNLLAILKQYLTDLRVFRVGQTEIEVFVVGQMAEGNWAGIKTMSVET